MVVLGTDAHKRSHTVVACDEVGAEIATLTVPATPPGHLRLVKWAAQFTVRRWAIEDCRTLSRRLEADLLKIGEQVVRVPPKLMAGGASFGTYSGQVGSDRCVGGGSGCVAGTGPADRSSRWPVA